MASGPKQTLEYRRLSRTDRLRQSRAFELRRRLRRWSRRTHYRIGWADFAPTQIVAWAICGLLSYSPGGWSQVRDIGQLLAALLLLPIALYALAGPVILLLGWKKLCRTLEEPRIIAAALVAAWIFGASTGISWSRCPHAFQVRFAQMPLMTDGKPCSNRQTRYPLIWLWLERWG